MASMLQDLIEFSKEKEPEKPKEEKGKHPLSFPDGDRIQTQTSISNAVGIAEKIRQQKEQEEARRKAIEKFLPKKQKKINLEKFLKRNLEHEQKKQYDIEVMRNKNRDEERKAFQEKPALNKTTIEILKTINKPPIYMRTNEDIKKRQETLEALSKRYNQTQQNDTNQLTTFSNNEYKRNRTEISTNTNTERFNTWIAQQNEWSKKIMKKKMVRSASLEEEKPKTLQNEISNNPQLSNRSVILLKNTNRKSSFDRLTTENTFNKELLNMEHMPTFTPKINKNKFVNVKPRYYPDLTSGNKTTLNVIKQNRLKRKNKAKSVDRRKKNNEKDVMEVGHVRKTESVDHWSTTLLKMGKVKSNVNYVPVEVLYKLNIMHSGAWNENDVNNVPLQ